MSFRGPIILIDDDLDDQFLIKTMLEELNLPNELRLFENGLQGLNYLLTTGETPFLILCDMNMPVMNGMELRDKIDGDEYLKNKAIPFVFLTTSDDRDLVKQAFKGTIKGYFKKENSFINAKSLLGTIINYWQHCLHPNS